MARLPYRAAAISAFAAVTLLIVYQVYVSLSFGLILKPMSGDLGLATDMGGAISAAFMLAIAALQLPAGAAVDRLPPGKVLCVATLVCAGGSALLAVSDTVLLAIVSRLVMGAGAAFAFVGALKILSMLVAGARFALVIGIWQVLYSLLVAGLATATTAVGLETHWRLLMFLVAGAGLFVGGLMWLTDGLLPARTTNVRSASAPSANLKSVLGNREVLLAALFFGLTFGPLLAYSDLWAIPNQMAWGNSPEVAAGMAGMLPIGMGVGSLIVGASTDRFGRPRLIGGIFAAIGVAATVTLLFGPRLPVAEAFVLSFLFGAGCSASVIAIDHARAFSATAAGTAIGLVTAVGYVLATLLQTVIGLLVEARTAPGHQATGTDFAAGLLVIPLCFAAAIVVAMLMRPRPEANN